MTSIPVDSSMRAAAIFLASSFRSASVIERADPCRVSLIWYDSYDNEDDDDNDEDDEEDSDVDESDDDDDNDDDESDDDDDDDCDGDYDDDMCKTLQ